MIYMLQLGAHYKSLDSADKGCYNQSRFSWHLEGPEFN